MVPFLKNWQEMPFQSHKNDNCLLLSISGHYSVNMVITLAFKEIDLLTVIGNLVSLLSHLFTGDISLKFNFVAKRLRETFE